MKLLRFALGLAIVSASFPARAGRHRVVLDMEVTGRIPLANVLGTVTNIRKAFVADGIEIEVVCHGPGLDLVMNARNDLVPRIAKLQSLGVVFAACANTMKGRHVTKAQLIRGAVVVDAGSAELIRKQEAGWSYLRM